MSKTSTIAIESLKSAINNAVKSAIEKNQLPSGTPESFIIESPAGRSHGDLATNVAMVGARVFKMPPAKIAQAIKDNICLEGTAFSRCEVAGPGFINFFLSPSYFADVVSEVVSMGSEYGKSDFGKGKKINVEFVSANPTGPMHMGNARGGALGDCLAAVMDAAGYDVKREFYVNDAGNQIEKFAASLNARYMQLFDPDFIMPEDGYQGDDIKDLAKEFKEIYQDSFKDVEESQRKKALVDYALPKNIVKMQADMKKYRIEYDKWFFESELHKSGKVKAVVDLLTEKGLTYEKEGALWYKNAQIVTERLQKSGMSLKDIEKLELKDDVLIRANGNPTYFAADIAYHKDKFDRGFDTCINIWGADHHGHVARMKGAMDAIGLNGDKLDIVLMQLVRLVRNGEVVRMSKRTGKAIQLADLLEEVPVDSTRFLFNTREANTQMDFDLDLAVTQDNQNPVYYVQYAHARICSIFRNLAADGIVPRKCTGEELQKLTCNEEIELIHHLSAYSDEVVAAAKDYDPTRITRYVAQLAALFHKFYNAHRVKVEDEALMQARLTLCTAVKTVINNVLTMFNVSCPDKM